MNNNGAGPLKRVLVVDDFHPRSLFMVKLLTKAGYECASANSGVAGLEEARRFRPDLAVLDVWMPDLKGPEVALRLRDYPETRATRVLFMSGMSETRGVMGPMSEFADVPFLSLPVEDNVIILKAVEKALSKESGPRWLVRGALRLDLATREFILPSCSGRLAEKLFKLVRVLMEEGALSRDLLARRLSKKSLDRHLIDRWVYRLRRALGPDGINIIVQVSGGYGFVAPQGPTSFAPAPEDV